MADLVSLRDRRARAIAFLSERFAADDLDLEEYERRVTLAHTAASVAEIDKNVEDLGGLPATATPPASSTALVPLSDVRDKQTLVAIMGGVDKQGTWSVPRKLRCVAIMGGQQIDFREARLPPGVTEVQVFAMMGGIDIIVPPELSVEMEGSGIMGGFEDMHRASAAPDPDRPRLRITGFAVMGGVSIETRLPGETEADARRRRGAERRERRAQRRL